MIKSFTLNATQIANGNTVSGTLTLDTPAPVGGIRVLCSTDDPALRMPKDITVLPGQTSATFTVLAGTLTYNKQYRVRAQLFHQTCSAMLTATGSAIAELYFTPQYVNSQDVTVLKVTLTDPSPEGGAVIVFDEFPDTNGISYLPTLPASVLIPEGDTYATLTMTLPFVANNGYTDVRATYGNVTMDAYLYVTGAG